MTSSHHNSCYGHSRCCPLKPYWKLCFAGALSRDQCQSFCFVLRSYWWIYRAGKMLSKQNESSLIKLILSQHKLNKAFVWYLGRCPYHGVELNRTFNKTRTLINNWVYLSFLINKSFLTENWLNCPWRVVRVFFSCLIHISYLVSFTKYLRGWQNVKLAILNQEKSSSSQIKTELQSNFKVYWRNEWHIRTYLGSVARFYFQTNDSVCCLFYLDSRLINEIRRISNVSSLLPH